MKIHLCKAESNSSICIKWQRVSSCDHQRCLKRLIPICGISGVQARTVLWYLTFVGFALNYMLRINTNITIVDMVKPRKSSTNNSVNVTKCHEVPEYHNLTSQLFNGSSEEYLRNYTTFTIERAFLDKFEIDYEKHGFDWNEYEQGLVLGSFYWLHWVTQIPGGILARRYGTKLVFGLSNLIGCLMCALVPIFSYWNYDLLIWLRVIQGLIVGLAWPAMHTMAGRWIPPNERSKFVTAYLGSSVGIALCYPLFGFVISWSSWEYVFHLCAVIGVIWYLAWYFLIFDSPAQHPRISAEERNYIEKALGTTVQKDAGSTPWIAIMKNKAVWMTVAAQWGGIWGLFTLMTQAPTYFKMIHGWSIEMTGILSGVPHIGRISFAYGFSILGDYLLRTNKMSRTNVRKLAGLFCCVVNGVFIVFLAYSECNTVMGIIFLTLGTSCHGAVSTGPLANIVDLSPNHAGVLLGISGMIGVLPGFISPVIVGYLTLGNVCYKLLLSVLILIPAISFFFSFSKLSSNGNMCF